MVEEALKEKELGNEAYKKKDFASAHEHYGKAIELDPTNITFYSNKAACYFEEGKYDDCIEICSKGVEVGRENRADFALVAKAYKRIGDAYLKKDDRKNALLFWEKSLSEHRDQALVNQKTKLEKEMREEERKSYINPELSEQEKLKGNEAFKQGDYPTAMKHYSEAIKRNPDNAVLFSNRAACFAKLMEWQRAIEDCDTSIKLDPKFLKAYLRKGSCLLVAHEFSRAQKVYEDALFLDPNNREAREGLMACSKSGEVSAEKSREEALKDPEIQAILSDPSMRLILEQMTQNPAAASEHMKNPDIFSKIMKLQQAGIVGIR